MKKVLVSFVLVSLLCVPALAMNGIKAYIGPAYTNLRTSEAFDMEVDKSGLFQFSGGLGFEFQFHPNLALDVNLMYTPSGCKWTDSEFDVEMWWKGYAITVPVLAKFRFNPASSPYIVGGLNLGYILKESYRIEIEGEEFDSYELESDEKASTFYGLIFGGGYELNMANMTLLFELRFQYGLSNVVTEEVSGPDDWIKTSNFIFLIGYKF